MDPLRKCLPLTSSIFVDYFINWLSPSIFMEGLFFIMYISGCRDANWFLLGRGKEQ